MATIPTSPSDLFAPGQASARRAPTPPGGRVKRYAFAGAGVGCVGLAGVGVVVPGMPTTVFLIVASWCFARSCPWLTDRLIRNRFFAPFVRYLEPGAVMPRRAKVISMAMMWSAIALSSVWAAWRGAPWFVPVVIASGGVVGSWFIVRQGRKARLAAGDTAGVVVRHDAARTFRDRREPARARAGVRSAAESR